MRPFPYQLCLSSSLLSEKNLPPPPFLSVTRPLFSLLSLLILFRPSFLQVQQEIASKQESASSYTRNEKEQIACQFPMSSSSSRAFSSIFFKGEAHTTGSGPDSSHNSPPLFFRFSIYCTTEIPCPQCGEKGEKSRRQNGLLCEEEEERTSEVTERVFHVCFLVMLLDCASTLVFCTTVLVLQ